MSDYGFTFMMLTLVGIGVALGLWVGLPGGRNAQQREMLNAACESACSRLGSEMLSRGNNTCTCADLTTMRGDYGMLFLGGQRN